MRTLLVWILLVTTPARAALTRFDLRDAGQRNIVQFVSDAWIEKTIGITSAVSGWIEVDPEALASGLKGEVEVDVRTFRTANEAKNDGLREKLLRSGESPYARFVLAKLASASGDRLTETQPVVVRVEGTMNLHGVSQPIVVLLKVQYFTESPQTLLRLPGNLLRLSADFDVDLAKFEITFPEALRPRVARFIQISADCVGTDRPPVVFVPRPSEGR